MYKDLSDPFNCVSITHTENKERVWTFKSQQQLRETPTKTCIYEGSFLL